MPTDREPVTSHEAPEHLDTMQMLNIEGESVHTIVERCPGYIVSKEKTK